MFKYDENTLKKQLTNLVRSGRVIFAASCATRLLPAYDVVREKIGIGAPKLLTEANDLLWESACESSVAQANAENVIAELMQLLDEQDASESEFVAIADDAVTSTIYALQVSLDNTIEEAEWAARRVYETLDNYVINSTGIDVRADGGEAKVLLHSLIQHELFRQERDLHELLEMNPLIGHDAAELFRVRALEEPALIID